MTEGTNKGLFITVAIVIFGIFVGLSYLLFEDTLNPAMVNLFNDGTSLGDNTGVPSNSDKEYEDYYNSFTPTEESYFEFDKETGTIIGYSDAGPKDVVIPKQIEGVDVKRIGEFSDAYSAEFMTQYQKAVEENTVEEFMKDEKWTRFIEIMSGGASSNAFYYKGINSVVIPSTVTEINLGSFEGNLLTELVLPNSITSIGANSFYYNGIEKITFGNSVKNIGSSAFQSNLLTSVEIPDSVTTIGSSAFYNNKLTSVVIPDSVTSIGSAAFDSNLLKSVEIPNSVTTIGEYAFRGNLLTSVEIPNSVTTIGYGAFDSNRLTSVEIGNSVTEIGEYAFYNNLLTSVVIPDSVKTIGTDAFTNNTTLKTVELPKGLEIATDTYQKGAIVTNRTK